MPSLTSTLKTGAPYHLLRPSSAPIAIARALTHNASYGTLLGSTLFQSFIGGVIAFRVLPRPQFAQLQSKTFPVYFAMQSILPVVMALTFPSRAGSVGFGALRESSTGLLADVNRGALVSIATMFVSGLVNLVYVGPATTKCMRERKHQETRDGKKSYDAGPHSPEMQRLNKKFAMLHGISSLTNLGGLFAQFFYGVVLAQRM